MNNVMNQVPFNDLMMMKNHQIEAVDRLLKSVHRSKSYNGYRYTYAVMAAGTGKTAVVSALVANFIKDGLHVLVLVDRKDIEKYLENIIFSSLYEKPNSGKNIPLSGNERFYKDIAVASMTTSGMELAARFSQSEFDVIISYDFLLGIKASWNPENPPPFFNKNGLVMSIVSSESTKAEKLYGVPVYTYHYTDAIRDHTALPVQQISCSDIGEIVVERSNAFLDTLRVFLADFYKSGSQRKAFVVCKSWKEAELIYNSLASFVGPDIDLFNVNGSLPVSAKYNAVESMRDKNKKCIAVVVNMFLTGSDFPYLTDIVILRRLSTESLFHQLISRINRPADFDKRCTIWDFGGNKKYFRPEFGSIEYHEPDEVIEIPKKNNQQDIMEGVNESNSNIMQQKATQKRVIPVGDGVSDKDLLGREKLVHILKGLIDFNIAGSNFRPFVIGLFGAWGTGKSTVINLLKNKYSEEKNITFIDFNAWQNEHCSNMGAALAYCIVEELYQRKSIFNQAILAVIQQVFLKKDRISQALAISVLLLVPAAFFVEPEQIDKFIGTTFISRMELGDFFTFVPAFVVLVFLALMSYLKHPFTSKVLDLTKKPDYSEHLGVAQKIKSEINSLFNVHNWISEKILWIRNIFYTKSLGNSTKNNINSQFIVIVDDLDRCDDEKIIEVLEAIRLIIDLKSVIVVLAVDKNILLNAVVLRYKRQNSYLSTEQASLIARDYLGKIIQISVELDKPEIGAMKSFVSERLYKNIAESSLVLQSVENGIRYHANQDGDVKLYDSILASDGDINLWSNVDDYYEDDEEYERSDVYLDHSSAEAEFFGVCTGVFGEANPRTLVRIHNTITLLKGMFPSIIDNIDDLKCYIFFTFLNEKYASSDSNVRNELEHILSDNDPTLHGHRLMGIRQLIKNIYGNEPSLSNVQSILARVLRFSLPCLQSYKELEAESV